LRALALNREAKADMEAGRKGILGREKAVGKFERSAALLRESGSDRDLLLDNLRQLKALAERRGKTAAVARLEAEIAGLQVAATGGGVVVVAPPPAKDPELAARRAETARLMEESAELQQLLALREAEVKTWNGEQMKTKLILMQQQQMLDSLAYRSNIDSLAAANATMNLKKSEQARLVNYGVMGVLVLLALLLFFGYSRARQHGVVLEEKNRIIREEKEKSDTLLLNILPKMVAEELLRSGRNTARKYEQVSVLFADFVGFSRIAADLSPEVLVSLIDTCFRAFDDIVGRHGLEKIKTIGDAYMCAGGIDGGGGDQLVEMVGAGLEMQAWLDTWNAERSRQGLPRFDARVGIHCGPVVGGVVGSRKFAYDIWGDTVNIASRVEQAGEGGKINISGEVYERVKGVFPCSFRGNLEVKNRGRIDMYFVEN
jgi:class 3 adenylate cyclase